MSRRTKDTGTERSNQSVAESREAASAMRMDFIHPILRASVRKHLCPELHVGTVVLEIGAGTRSVLRGIAGDDVPAGVIWRESDHDVEIYETSGRYETEKYLAALPDLVGIASGSADLIVGLSVLDAISQKGLPAAFLGMERVLREGGTVVQFFDIQQTFNAEAPLAAEQGLIPFGYMGDRPGKPGAFRIAYLLRGGLEDLVAEMKRINAPVERVQFMQSLLDEPAVAWNSNDPESIAPKAAILEKFRQMGLMAADHDAIELLTSRLRDAAERAGFEVEVCGEAPEEASLPRSALQEYPPQLRLVEGGYGVMQMFAEDLAGPVPEDQVRVRFSPLVFVARKCRKKDGHEERALARY
jgi:hypothetical protein